MFVGAQLAQAQLTGEDVEQIDGREVEHEDPPEYEFGGWVVVDACVPAGERRRPGSGGALPARRLGPSGMR
ncbi:hypothetical protein GCM10009864_17640 [Streptomyces lunalinharesii]|uniref:Uncharacterized protein n=1 Tax=Streptomyces lunalinharesii TaxID=333384 RepID=A0ABP6DUV7_9ACTN